MTHMVETMAYAGEVPWHGLGERVPADLSPEQMLEKAGLNWEVEKLPIFAQNGKNKIAIPNKELLIRSSDGASLDVVGSDWNPLQNLEAFEFFNDFVCSGDMEMHTAGSLEGGRRVWALAKVNDAFEVFKEDVIEQYLLFSNPHKYGMSIDVRMTPVRVVCNNTITVALNKQSNKMVRVNHRKQFDAELVMETLGVAKEKLDTYKEAAKFLGKKKYKNETILEYFQRVFPKTSGVKAKNDKIIKLADVKNGKVNDIVSRNARIALDVINTQPGAEHGRGSWWQAFNTVTYMTDHIIGRGEDTRMQSAWYGNNAKKKEDALKLALEYAEAA